MSETKWTPGPWTTRQARLPVDGEFDWCIAATMDGAQHVIVEAFGRVAEHVRPNAEANSRLISAAPDMAEALQAAIDCGMVPISSVKEGGAFRHSRQVEVADMIRAALAKARGET